ncbi:hypothetical protein [Rhodococcus sp. BE178]|uniref:hypothetical protein n=1 Tax=Rhodococcus sp. BE178 TaxID=2817737 RepID=UPI003D18FED1
MSVLDSRNSGRSVASRVPLLGWIVNFLVRSSERGSLPKIIYGAVTEMTVVAVLIMLALYIWVFPDGSSTDDIVYFFTTYRGYVKAAMLFAAFLFVLLLCISGAIAGRLFSLDSSPGHRVSWIGFGSDIAVMTIFAMITGITASVNLLAGQVSADIVHALHVVSFTSAFILGGLWIPFLVSFILISVRSREFPIWLNWFAVCTVILNGFSLFACLTLSGPFNGQNGLLALGGATVGPIPFLFFVSAHIFLQEVSEKAVKVKADLGMVQQAV